MLIQIGQLLARKSRGQQDELAGIDPTLSVTVLTLLVRFLLYLLTLTPRGSTSKINNNFPQQMDAPLELFLIVTPYASYPNLTTLKAEMMTRYPRILIQQISYNQLYNTLNTLIPKSNRIFLLITQNLPESQEVERIINSVDNSGAGMIMYPHSVSRNPAHLVARSPQEIISCVGMFQKQAQGMTRSRSVTGMSVAAGSRVDLNVPLVGVNIFHSNNLIFKNDMNSLFQSYRNDRRVKFNEVTSLDRIPVIPGGRHLIFVCESDMNVFVPQLMMVQNRPDKFFPILYNTSRKQVVTGQYFYLAVNDLKRAMTEVNAYLANGAYMGSVTDINNVNGVYQANLRPVSPGVPGTMLASRTGQGSFKRLIVIDNGNPHFQQLYQNIPADFLLIPHLQQNAVFKEPTLLLAPYDSHLQVLSAINPEVNNARCVFYSSSPNYGTVNNHLVGLISNNHLEISRFLQQSGIQFRGAQTLTTTNHLEVENVVERSMKENNFINTSVANAIAQSAHMMWGNTQNSTYGYEWNVRRRPGNPRHTTYQSTEEDLHMNRTSFNSPTRMLKSVESRQDFELNSIPNQSHLIGGRQFVGSPEKNVSGITEVMVQNDVSVLQSNPVAHTSKMVEEVYEEIVIGAKQRQPNQFRQNTNTQNISVVPPMSIVPKIQLTQSIEELPPTITDTATFNTTNLEILNPPPPRNFSISHSTEFQTNVLPPPVSPPPMTTTTTTKSIKETIIIPPISPTPPPPVIVQVPPITRGYYSPPPTLSSQHLVSLTPPKPISFTSSNVNTVYKNSVESDGVDLNMYQRLVQNGRVTYVMRQQHKNRLIENAMAKPAYNEAEYVLESPRIRRSRVAYDNVVKSNYNDIDYVLDGPRIRKSRVLIQEVLPSATAYMSPTTQVFETATVSPVLDAINYECRVENGVKVYYKRSGVSPSSYRRAESPLRVENYTTGPAVVLNQPQILKRSFVLEDMFPKTTERVMIQSPELIETRRPSLGFKDSRVHRGQRVNDVLNRYPTSNQPINLIFKKLNNTLVNTSQYFKDPQYRTHKYYSSSQLASIANTIPYHQPILLIADDIPDQMDYFTHHHNFNTVVVPKGKTHRSQYTKYPKYKWIFEEDPQIVADEIVTYIDEKLFNRPNSNRYRNSRVDQGMQSMSPFNNPYRNDYRESPSSNHRILLFPIDRTQIKDFVSSRLPNSFDFIPYSSMDSLTKQLSYWPNHNIIIVLVQPFTQQIPTLKRISRSLECIVYNPDMSDGYNGYNDQMNGNGGRKARNVHELVAELQGVVGTRGRSNEYRSRENRGYNY